MRDLTQGMRSEARDEISSGAESASSAATESWLRPVMSARERQRDSGESHNLQRFVPSEGRLASASRHLDIPIDPDFMVAGIRRNS
jgi:hypothetical protein